MNTTTTSNETGPLGRGNETQWIRLPKPGQYESNTGLTRSVLTRLCIEGKVRSLSLREPGKARGCRLVNLQSLFLYLSNLEADQNSIVEIQP
jgi:hypothetical protein